MVVSVLQTAARLQATHTISDTTASQTCTLHCYPGFTRIRSNPVPKSLRINILPILILDLGLKHRTPWPIPFSRQHYGKSDKIWVGRLVVAEQSIRTPLNLQEVWQRGPAPTPPCCSSQPRASNGDFPLDCITDTDATAPLQMACASCMSVPVRPGSGTGSPVRQIERVPLSSTLNRRPSLRRHHFIFMVVSRLTSLNNAMRMTFSFLHAVQCQSRHLHCSTKTSSPACTEFGPQQGRARIVDSTLPTPPPPTIGQSRAPRQLQGHRVRPRTH